MASLVHGPLAQLAERRADNAKVVRSRLTWTIHFFFSPVQLEGGVVMHLCHVNHNNQAHVLKMATTLGLFLLSCCILLPMLTEGIGQFSNELWSFTGKKPKQNSQVRLRNLHLCLY